MAFFDTFKDKAMDLAQTGVAKSKQLAEIAKLNLANAGEEDNIKKAYIELGKLYYAERGMAPEAAYAALCEKVTAAKVNIEENKARIDELKTEDGILEDDPVIMEVHPEEPVTPPAPPAGDDNVPPEEPPQF
ncbi:hypothetical protein CE91St43_13700 [Oscillospiraceae bacterium]|nr:hypothetical protein CE91St43_13700 [Oscillospiraceae bacterium]